VEIPAMNLQPGTPALALQTRNSRHENITKNSIIILCVMKPAHPIIYIGKAYDLLHDA
jgi:hypothetical protein